MNLKKYAKVCGVVFILIGILGFMPGITLDSMFLGIFQVNAALNIVYLATGMIAYWTSITSTRASKLFFQLFGLIYTFIAVMGFGYGDADIFACIANNGANNWLHLAIALMMLYLGFLYKHVKE